MQTVGSFMMNPSGDQMPTIGRQLNTKNNLAKSAFAAIFQNVSGESNNSQQSETVYPVEVEEVITTVEKLLEELKQMQLSLPELSAELNIQVMDKSESANNLVNELNNLLTEITTDLNDVLVAFQTFTSLQVEQLNSDIPDNLVTGSKFSQELLNLSQELTDLIKIAKLLHYQSKTISQITDRAGNQLGADRTQSMGQLSGTNAQNENHIEPGNLLRSHQLTQIKDPSQFKNVMLQFNNAIESLRETVQGLNDITQLINNEVKASYSSRLASTPLVLDEIPQEPISLSNSQVKETVEANQSKLEQLEESVKKLSRSLSKLSEKMENFSKMLQKQTSLKDKQDIPKAEDFSFNPTLESQKSSNSLLKGLTSPDLTQHESLRLFNSILADVSSKAQLVKNSEQSEFFIQLKPEFLGKLQMKISVENGMVTARFAAESHEVKELLDSNINNLRQNLADQGIKVDRLDVSLSSEKQFNMFDQGRFQRQQRTTRRKHNSNGVVTVSKPVINQTEKYRWMFDSTVDYTI